MHIKIIKEDQKDALTNLRTSAFVKSRHFSLKNTDFLVWSEDDLKFPVLGIEENDRLISTFRIRKLKTASELETALDCKLHDFQALPAIVGEKMTTAIDKRGLGLAGLIRYFAYRNIANSGIQSICVIINEGAKRIEELQNLGFEFTEADISNRTSDNIFQPNTKPLLGILYHENFQKFVETTEKTLKIPFTNLTIENGLDQYLTEYLNS